MNEKLTTALCSLIALAALAATPASGADGPPPARGGEAPGRVSLDAPDRGLWPPRLLGSFGGRAPVDYGRAVVVPFGPYVGAEGVFGDGLGYESYYGASLFMPLHLDPGTNLMFSSLHAWGAEDGGFVGNIGTGYRHYVPGLDRVFGISSWFDIDDSHSDTFTRGGVSLESLGRWMDFRANGYWITGDESNVASDRFVGDPFFRGFELIQLRRRIIDSAYSGGDFEIGGPIPFLGRYGLSSYIGGYFLTSDDDEDTAGVKLRGEIQATDDMTVGMQYSHDDVFGDNFYVNVAYTWPDGIATRWFRQRPVKEKLAIPVEREMRVAVHRRADDTAAPLINPADGQAFTFAHIDPNAGAGGNGSFENPFGSVAAFNNNAGIDVIYVRPGTPANLDGGFTLFNNQRLLSSSVQHTFTAAQGTFVLPGFSAGALPTLSNTGGGQVIALASNNEVSGFIIDGGQLALPHANGIIGDNIAGFNINRNTFNNTRNSVLLTNVQGGTGLFNDNILNGSGVNSDRGFSVTNTANTLNLVVSNNTATNYQGDNEDANGNTILDPLEDTNGNGVLDTGTAFEITANNSTVNATITNNVATNNGTGLALNSVNGGTVNATLEGNDFSGNVAVNTGLRLAATGNSTMQFALRNNNISNNNGNGLGLFTRTGGTITGTAVSGNLMNNNAAAGIAIDSNTGGVALQSITDNIISRNTAGEEGIAIEAVDANVTLASVLRNQILGGNANSGMGIAARIEDTAAAGGASLTLNVGDGTVANQNLLNLNGDAGIGIELVDVPEVVNAGNPVPTTSATALVTVRGNTISNTTNGTAPNFNGDAVRIRAGQNSRVLNGSIVSNNLVQGNAGAGVGVEVRDFAVVESMTINNNDFLSNVADGVSFFRSGSGKIGSVAEIGILANRFNQNGDGIDITAGTVSLDPVLGTAYADRYNINGNVISNGTGRGVHLHVDADAHLLANMTANRIEDNAGDGIQVTEQTNASTDQRSVSGTWSRNIIADNTGHGIKLDGVTGHGTLGDLVIGSAIADLADANLIDSNGLDGIEVEGPGGVTIGGNFITANGTGGIDFGGDDADGDTLRSQHASIVTGNQIVGNNGDGIAFTRTISTGFVGVDIRNNRIADNTGRGVDILNRGDRSNSFINSHITDVTVNDNTITGNGQEGIYVVNTANAGQSQTSTTLVGAGSVATNNYLDLTIHNNTIGSNGVNSGLTATGLVMRIGAMDGIITSDDSITDDGGFATTGGVVGNAGLGAAATFTRGGVYAEVTENRFSGNFGDDMIFHSFDESTATPGTTSGTWSATTFDITTYEQDPLARLDLHFDNNTFDSAALTVSGASFNNTEGNFKSRTDQSGTTPDGPFGSATRIRNAQRQAGRFGLGPAAPDADATNFFYSGIGQSTFRLSQTSETFRFAVDNFPYTGLGDATTGGVDPGTSFGELDWGWSLMP